MADCKPHKLDGTGSSPVPAIIVIRRDSLAGRFLMTYALAFAKQSLIASATQWLRRIAANPPDCLSGNRGFKSRRSRNY